MRKKNIWHVTGDTWHVTCDMWHVTHSVGWTFSQNFSSLALPVWDWQCIEDIWTKGSVIELMNEWITTRLYGRSRQCGRPVGARCSMGLGRNPLINGLIQHTFKLYILFLEKFTVIPFDWTKLFPVDHKSPWCFRKKDFLKMKKKIGVRFLIEDPPAKPAKQKKKVALEKSLRLHTRGGPAVAAKGL